MNQLICAALSHTTKVLSGGHHVESHVESIPANDTYDSKSRPHSRTIDRRMDQVSLYQIQPPEYGE